MTATVTTSRGTRRAPVRGMTFAQIERANRASVRRGAKFLEDRRKRELVGPFPLSQMPGGTFEGFGAQNLGRLTLDWVAGLRSADADVRGIMRQVRARARDLERLNAYAEGYLEMLTVNVIGPHGFKHQAHVENNNGEKADRVNTYLEDAFEEWADTVSLDGKLSLVDFEDLGLRTVARDGECPVRFWTGTDHPHGLALEMIDADVLDDGLTREASEDQNAIRMGVEVDRYGRPVAYHCIEGLYEGATSTGSQWQTIQRVRIPAVEILHLYRMKRPNQSRGVTWMLPSMVPLKMLDKYEEAEMVASGLAASKGGFFTNKNGDGEVDYDASTDPNGSDDTGRPNPIRMSMDPGVMEQLPPGWEFTAWDPQHPNTGYGQFVKGALRKVATGLACSYNALANDLEGVNYSSMRSGLLIERDHWKRLQRWWIRSFRRRVYERWLMSARMSGAITLDSRDPSKFRKAIWTPRGWPWVDPLKDVTAAVLAIQNGLNDRTTVVGEEGRDLEETLKRLGKEKELATAAGVPEVITGGVQADPKKSDAEEEAKDEDKAAENGAAKKNGKATNRVLQLAHDLIAIEESGGQE